MIFNLFRKKQENIKDPNPDTENKEESLDINTFDDIENIVDKKSGIFSRIFNKKPVVFVVTVLVLVFCTIVFVAVGVTFLSMNDTGSKTPDEPEDTAPGLLDSAIKNTTTSFGQLQRDFSDRLVILPANRKESVLYYFDGDEVENNLEQGDLVYYEYYLKRFIPTITNVQSIYEGTVVRLGLSSVAISFIENKQTVLVDFLYNESLQDKINALDTNDKIFFVFERDINEYKILEIFEEHMLENIFEKHLERQGSNPVSFGDSVDPKVTREEFLNEYIIIENREERPALEKLSHLTDNRIYFYNSIQTPIWIRLAWKVSDKTSSVPLSSEATVELFDPAGEKVDFSLEGNRFWLDTDIFNFAIKNPMEGEYVFLLENDLGMDFGQVQVMVLGLDGFININNIGVVQTTQDTADIVWNIGGVIDENFEIEVYFKSKYFTKLMYKGSSLEDGLYLIDKVSVDISNFQEGSYEVVARVRDKNVATSDTDDTIPVGTFVVTSRTIVHENINSFFISN